MNRWLLVLFSLVLAACAPAAQIDQPEFGPLATPRTNTPASAELPVKSNYPDLGPAPELSGSVWLNTSIPLRLADLRGRVVLVDMWTFG